MADAPNLSPPGGDDSMATHDEQGLDLPVDDEGSVFFFRLGENQFTYGRRDINRSSLSITGVTPETADAMIQIEKAREAATKARTDAARDIARLRAEAAAKQAAEATRQAEERTKQVQQQAMLAIKQAEEDTARAREATKQAQQETLRERELTSQSEETTKRSAHQITKAALVCGVVFAAILTAALVPGAAVSIGVIVTVLGGIAAGTYTLTERGRRKQLPPSPDPKALPPKKE